MKRRFSFILSILAVLLATASCGTAEEQLPETNIGSEKATEAAETTEKDRLDDLGEADFDGAEFVIMDANDHPDTYWISYSDERAGDVINDRLAQRDAAISERYNVSVRYEQIVGAKDAASVLRNEVMAGDSTYQLSISTIAGGSLETLAIDGILANLCEVPYLQLDSSWWARLMYDNIRFANRMYYTAGHISPNLYCMPFVTYLNKKLLADYDINTDFYGLVDDGKWTLDVLHDTVKDRDADLNSDGKMHMDDDFFGLATQGNELASTAMFIGAGVSYSSIAKDSLTVDLNTQAVQNTLEKLQRSVRLLACNDNNDFFKVAFKEDRVLAMFHMTSAAKLFLRDMESDYLILPMPKFDEAQDGYRSYINIWNNSFIGIPLNADLEFAGFITEALDYWSYKNIYPAAYDLVMKEKGARDEKSQRMLDIVFDSLYVDFNCIYNFGSTSALLCNCLYNGDNLASGMEKIGSKTEEAVADFCEAWVKNE